MHGGFVPCTGVASRGRNPFAAAVFTNLTRDHLDFHGDMESYFRAKRRLFEMLGAGAPGFINFDDLRGARLSSCRAAGRATRSIALPTSRRGRSHVSWEGMKFDIRTPRGTVTSTRNSSVVPTFPTSWRRCAIDDSSGPSICCDRTGGCGPQCRARAISDRVAAE